MRIPVAFPPPDRRECDLLAIGANSLDLLTVVETFPKPDGKQPMRRFLEAPGGEAATAAAAVARMGFSARYIGRVGPDRHAATTLAALGAAGVDTSAVIVVPDAASQFAVIIVEAGTGRRSVISHRAPGIVMQAADVPPGAASRCRLLLVDGHGPGAALAAAGQARSAGTPVLVDVDHVAPETAALLAAADIVFVPEGLAETLTGRMECGAALDALQRQTGAAVVGATLGPGGSLTRCGGREFRTPAFSVDVVDTTGAGDAFRAGFAAGWLALGADGRLADVLRWAAAVAALSCRGLGAQGALPCREDVERLLSQDRPG